MAVVKVRIQDGFSCMVCVNPVPSEGTREAFKESDSDSDQCNSRSGGWSRTFWSKVPLIKEGRQPTQAQEDKEIVHFDFQKTNKPKYPEYYLDFSPVKLTLDLCPFCSQIVRYNLSVVLIRKKKMLQYFYLKGRKRPQAAIAVSLST